MKVYSDLFSNEEIISDSFVITPIFEEVGGEVKSEYLTKGVDNVDIGRGNEFGGGGGDEETDDKVEKVLNLIDAFHYQETSFDKKDYVARMKVYMKNVMAKLQEEKPERVEPFKKGATEMIKWIVKTFEEFTFYTPESYDFENSIILSYYKGEDETPTFVFFMDGLRGELV